jgi:hydrogenase nickel incorporation protein HypA/HybF
MTKALILTVKDWWESQPERPQISQIHLIVGKFTCVEPASLQFAFEVLIWILILVVLQLMFVR